MASTPTFQPNPYANFDPSQWTNPYSQFYGKALPWPSSYAGTPNNALGQPIQQPQPPGMTLNQTPQQPQAPAAAAPSNQFGIGNAEWAAMSPRQQSAMAPQGVVGYSNQVDQGNGSAGQYQPIYGPMQAPQQQAAPQAAAPAAPNNWQSTLSMLANPGQVNTPGATVPQAPQGSAQPSPGVLQNFLANWQPAQSGPGSGFTQNFNTILRGLQAKGS